MRPRGARPRESVVLLEVLEPFAFSAATDGTRLAWVTWEIRTDGYGFATRRCVGVREA